MKQKFVFPFLLIRERFILQVPVGVQKFHKTLRNPLCGPSKV